MGFIITDLENRVFALVTVYPVKKYDYFTTYSLTHEGYKLYSKGVRIGKLKRNIHYNFISKQDMVDYYASTNMQLQKRY